MMKIEILSRETIKPSSPTSSHLQTYNLSELDLLNPKFYTPLVFFYKNNDDHVSLTYEQKVVVLKKSLSQSLTRYYPFAGRLPTPTSSYVDCDDEGFLFVEARTDNQLDTIKGMIGSNDEALDQLFADDLVMYNNTSSKHPVAVQLTRFACGGFALAISFSHAIGDFCSLSSFLNHWASVARYGSVDHKDVFPLNPHFIQSPRTHQPGEDGVKKIKLRDNLVLRKFVFSNSKLSELKNKVASESGGISNPTRVEVLTSLIYKTIVEAETAKSGCFNPSYLFFMVNVRDRLVPKLSQFTVGNLVKVMMVQTRDISETSISLLAKEVREKKLQLEGIKSMQQLVESTKSFNAKVGNGELENVANGSYWFSSLCGLAFNKLDFGWGKPMGINLGLKCVNTSRVTLMDTVDDDGIEAVIVLDKECMDIFANDKEMLSYCHIGYYGDICKGFNSRVICKL